MSKTLFTGSRVDFGHAHRLGRIDAQSETSRGQLGPLVARDDCSRRGRGEEEEGDGGADMSLVFSLLLLSVVRICISAVVVCSSRIHRLVISHFISPSSTKLQAVDGRVQATRSLTGPRRLTVRPRPDPFRVGPTDGSADAALVRDAPQNPTKILKYCRH